MNRNLDTIYFRVKREEGYCNVCFSDLTHAEMVDCIYDYSKESLIRLAIAIGIRLRAVGDLMNIQMDYTDEEPIDEDIHMYSEHIYTSAIENIDDAEITVSNQDHVECLYRSNGGKLCNTLEEAQHDNKLWEQHPENFSEYNSAKEVFESTITTFECFNSYYGEDETWYKISNEHELAIVKNYFQICNGYNFACCHMDTELPSWYTIKAKKHTFNGNRESYDTLELTSIQQLEEQVYASNDYLNDVKNIIRGVDE